VTVRLTSVSSEVFLIEKEKKKVCQFIIARTRAKRERVTGRDRPRHPLRISSRPYPEMIRSDLR
jgi:hypothetical protein